MSPASMSFIRCLRVSVGSHQGHQGKQELDISARNLQKTEKTTVTRVEPLSTDPVSLQTAFHSTTAEDSNEAKILKDPA